MPQRHRRLVLMVVTACALLLAQNTARAEDANISGFLGDTEIRQHVIGHAFAGHYSNGKTWAEDYDVSGSLSYREANIDITGDWTLAGGVFCTFYRSQLGGGCWRVKRVSANCYEFYGASRGPRPSRTDRVWTARGWKTKEAPGCGAPQIS